MQTMAQPPRTHNFQKARNFLLSKKRNLFSNDSEYGNLEDIVIYAQQCAQQSWGRTGHSARDPYSTSALPESTRQSRNDLEKQISGYYNALEEKNNQLEEDLRKKNETMYSQRQEYETKCNEKDQIIRKLRGDLQDLRGQFGKNLSENTDQTITEKVSDTVGRPSEIQRKYEKLTTQDAGNLRNHLLQKPDNVQKEFWKMFVTTSVCALLQISWKEMKESYRSLMDNMSGLLYQPVNVVNTKQDHQKEQTKRDCSIPVELNTQIRNFLLCNAEKIVVDNAIENIIEKALDRASMAMYQHAVTDEEHTMMQQMCAQIRNHEVTRHITRESCMLAWQMVLQEPMISLSSDGIGEVHRPELQQLLPPASRSNTVLQYFEPAMLHGNSVLVKGRVLKGDPIERYPKMLIKNKSSRGQTKPPGTASVHVPGTGLPHEAWGNQPGSSCQQSGH